MATVEQTTSPARFAERDPQVYHPLDRLRGVIRRYVLIEGVISLFLFTAIWFALGLVLDYGLFKTTGWDWAYDGSWWLRLAALVVALGVFGVILLFRIARRVTKEFSYPALALVLERKFPKVLADRLITAVEMADVEAMGKFGYSIEMIRATIAEARERVGTVPVNEVFNWRRLWVMSIAAIALLVATVVVSFASHAIAIRSVSPVRFGWKFAHVSGIFFERNVALWNTPWPRRAHVELVGFPANGELAVGRDAPPPRVTARAYKWVIADRNVPEGWRPMLWSDVTEELIGRPVPLLTASAAHEQTVDSVETRSGSRADLQDVFAALIAKADEPSMGRTLRKLELTRVATKTDKDGNIERDQSGNKVQEELPIEVSYQYAGLRFRGGGTLNPQQNNEFSGEVGGLREDVEFVVKADDFTTRPKRIRLIPPPTLKRIYRIQHEPAYLHHAPPQGLTFNDLKGKRQRMTEKNVSLAGERSVFVVPAGTELVLTAEPDDGETDQLKSVHATPVVGMFPGAKQGSADHVPLPLSADGTFSIEFKGAVRLTDRVEFRVTFVNKYDVATTRTILIQVTQDEPPVVEVSADVIRKVGREYMVTPLARIPLNPESFIKDDRGLSKVEYTFNYYAEDSDVVRSLRAGFVMRSFLTTPIAGPQYLPALLLPRWHAENFRNIDKSDDRRSGSVFVSEFENQNAALRRDTKEKFEAMLASPLADGVVAQAVTKIELKKEDRDFFDLDARYPDGHPKGKQRLFDILAPYGEVQTIYRMDLNVQATDNNADNDGGPRITRTSEPIRLRIVSEGDLLIEISKEEEQLGTRLDEAIVKLAAAKRKYEFVRSKNGYVEQTPEQVDAVKVRSQDSLQDVDKARDIVQTVLREFRRIARECQVNRVNEVATNNYIRYANRIEQILSEDPNAAVAFPKTQNLMNAVQLQLNNSIWAPLAAVSDAEQSLYALERELIEIRKELGEAQSKEKLKNALLAIKLAEDRNLAALEKWAIEEAEKLKDPNPAIGNVGAALALTKGETKKVSHTIQWRQYKEDDLKVKLKASDPSIVVPQELTLNFEKHQFRFDYDVQAGTKEGTFTITVTPAAGKPVEVVVTVK